jgi:hypothetical protein
VAPLEHIVSIAFPKSSRLHVLGRGPLATSTADADAVDNVALLGLVPETAGLVGARGAAGAVDNLQLAKLRCTLSYVQRVHPLGCKCDPRIGGSYLPALSPVSKVQKWRNDVYVRGRASRSASCLTASSSEVPRHLRLLAANVGVRASRRTLEGTHLWQY